MPITLEQVSFSWQAEGVFKKQVLNNISFSLHEGEIAALLGPEGAGKTTLLQIMAGLVKPDRGTVKLDSRTIKLPGGYDGQIGMLFQFPEQQVFELNIYDEIAFGPKNQGLTGKKLQTAVYQAMQSVGLKPEEFLERYTDNISSGEKRRVAIAGVLAMQPRYLLLDEPLAGLDYEAATAVIECLHNINQQRGTTMLIVAHKPDRLLPLFNRYLILKSGRLITDFSSQSALSIAHILQQAEIELPVSLELIQHLAKAGGEWSGITADSDEIYRKIATRIRDKKGEE
ncbi:MAG: ATP-binding cassette domain-containing protein [Syntrophomonadaceae bacterium]|nr:ATP-binding cassette domain-containing protein [Syntrophomonadaceae bacterium]